MVSLLEFYWPWETQDMVSDIIGLVAMLILGGIVAIVGILIMTGKIAMPGGMLGRLLIGLAILGGGAYILLEMVQ